jgi:hypothetical protein
VSGTGYAAGGVTITNGVAAGLTGGTTFWTPTSIDFGTVTLADPFDAVMIYDPAAGDRNLGVFVFGAQTVTAAPYSLVLPTNDASNGLVRMA